MDIKMIRLQTHGDDRGSLVALEQENNIPFEIKRVYYMFKTGQNVRRKITPKMKFVKDLFPISQRMKLGKI